MIAVLRQLPRERIPRPILRAPDRGHAREALIQYLRARGRGDGAALPFDAAAIDTDDPVMIVPLTRSGVARFYAFTEEG